MTEFWESSFRDKQEMWGMQPADSAISAFELFKKIGLKTILIPGFGYGRNARVFVDNGFHVTGIEISETAIELSKKHFEDKIKIHHGSVGSMPFDQEKFDGIFCYSLIHLLDEKERKKLIDNCYKQLNPNGYMFFVALSQKDVRYGKGKQVGKNTFKTRHGVTLCFYDLDSAEKEFGNYGLVEAKEIKKPLKQTGNKPLEIFWQIICKK